MTRYFQMIAVDYANYVTKKEKPFQVYASVEVHFVWKNVFPFIIRK